jgi:hypothetical protein
LSVKGYFLIGQELVWLNIETMVKTELIGHFDIGFPIDRACLIGSWRKSANLLL